jgi:Mn2+/Fe2+ NRAMP family transporter
MDPIPKAGRAAPRTTLEETTMRRIIGTIGATLAIAFVMATSAAPASAAGELSPHEALENAQRDLEQALATF